MKKLLLAVVINGLLLCATTIQAKEAHPCIVTNSLKMGKNLEAEKAKYDKLWNENQTLKENQDYLIDNFITECCNFQSKIINGNFAYIDNLNYKEDKDNVSELMYAKSEIKQLLQQIVADPVGCKLIRILTAKYMAMSNEQYKKIIFFKDKDMDMNFCCIPKLELLFINLPDKTFKEEHMVYEGGNKFKIQRINKDAVFFHEMVHWLHCITNIEEYNKRKTINKTCIKRKFNDLSRMMIQQKNKKDECANVVLDVIFGNDEEFFNLFGLVFFCDAEQFDLLNEAAYTKSKYGYVRALHSGLTKSNEFDLTNHIANTFVKHQDYVKFLDFYFSDNFTLPKFGEGLFKYNAGSVIE